MRDGADTCVLLPVVAPGSVPALVEVAVAIAGAGGRLLALTAVPSGADAAAVAAARRTLARVTGEVTAQQGEVTAQQGCDVVVDSEVVEADHPAEAIHDLAGRVDADVVVMGWHGSGSAASSFGSIIDEVVGRSRVPLVMVRAGAARPSSIVVAFDTDQLHPAGRRGLALAGAVAASLRSARDWPITLLQTGADEFPDLPAGIATLTDRIHHDPRRRHDAVGALVDPTTLVVAPVAPTVAGLRAATTRLNWAVGEATLAVAIDVGPVGPRESLSRVTLPDAAGGHGPPRRRRQGVALTIVSTDPVERRPVMAALAGAGEVGQVRSWWAGRESRPHLSVTVTVDEVTESGAIGAVMAVTDLLPELVGARVRYDLVDAPTPLRVRELRPMGPLGELDQ